MTSPILYVIDSFNNPQAGTEGQLLSLIEGLDRGEYEPRLLVFSDSEYLRSGRFPCSYEVLGYSGLANFRAWRTLWQKISEFRKNGGRLVHAFFIDPSIMCPIICWLLKVPVVVSRRDMGYWYNRKYLKILHLSNRFVDVFIANSEAVKKIVSEKERVHPDLIDVIYNGFCPASPNSKASLDLPALCKASSNSTFAVVVANIRPLKRIDDAVKAVAVVRQKNVDLQLVIIGGGDQKELCQLAEELGISNFVHFWGARDDVLLSLPLFDIGILCSESEGFSNSLIEYMLAGMPVICSAVGGNVEAVKQGVNGFLYEVGDIKELSEKLELLSEDSAYRKEVGNNSKAFAQEKFAMNTMIASHSKVYGRLI